MSEEIKTPSIDDQILNQGIEDEGQSQEGGKPAAREETLELGSEDAPEATPEQIAAEEERKRSRPWSRRVDVLTARLRETERQLEELRTNGGKPAEGAKTPTLAEVESAKPKAEDFEFGTADPDYVDALTDWKLDVREAKQRDAAGKTAEQSSAQAARAEIAGKIGEGMAAVEKAGTERYDDFETRVAEAVEARGGEPLPPLLGVAIAVSPVGADIAYRLATDEAASDRLEQLTKTNPLKAAQAFGELEGEFTDDDDDLNLADPLDMARAMGRMRTRTKGNGNGGVKAAPAIERKVTKAPKPAEHRARGGAGQFEVSDDTDDFAAFEKKHMGRSK